MKTKLHFRILLLLLIPVLYFIITAGFKEKELIISTALSISTDTGSKDFINLIFTDKYFGRYNSNDPRALENNINNIKDSLHFNSVHIYGYDSSGGKFDDSISLYSSYISGLMDQVSNSGLNGYYGRWKIERLSYGQRLEYEAEGGNNGFSYSNNSGYVTTDSGRQVVRGCLNSAQCPETDATPRYLCQNIYENLQHGDLIDFTQLDSAEWFIKPVMRIDSNIVDTNPNDSVVRIDVFNYSGKKIRSIKVLTKDFSVNGQGNYGGNYVQRYWTSEPLSVTGESYDTIGLNYGMRKDSEWRKWKDSCKVDFKVWWYGKVEVWFDKMIVEDEYGDQLFSSDNSKSSCMDYHIKDQTNQENFNYIVSLVRNKKFKESNYPCVNYVLSKMYEYLYPIQYAQAR